MLLLGALLVIFVHVIDEWLGIHFMFRTELRPVFKPYGMLFGFRLEAGIRPLNDFW